MSDYRLWPIIDASLCLLVQYNFACVNYHVIPNERARQTYFPDAQEVHVDCILVLDREDLRTRNGRQGRSRS